MTTYQETVIVKKHYATNPSGCLDFMVGFHRSWSKPNTIFCDFDGPIVDVSDRYYSTYHLALLDTGRFYSDLSPQPQLNILTKAQFWQMKQNRIPDREIARQSGLGATHIDFFLERVVEIVNGVELLKQDKIQPGVTWALGLLRSQGCKLILVTLRDRHEAIEMLKQHQLFQLFTSIYGTDNTRDAYQNYAEVKTKLLEQAMRDYQVTSADASWMIGDTEADILAGRAMGISTIGLTCGIRSEQQLRQLQPTLIKSDLLCAAHHLVEVNSLQMCS
ncbi:HAD family hydrolase [Chamaesiphon sp. OTE_75_metabat_556]|uniref:HAD family hydrolase n=1 Tax=Chamaesiphon sp. OTE_75_metabat_556 TaxID=2964692 RepID=UPI00286CB79C|nr:HAD family hydrolase [Chamaesiphon sp. OTE_75_metabat_556]